MASNAFIADSYTGESRAFPGGGKPRLLVATRGFGAANQPWLWRQVVGMTSFETDVLCWKRSNRKTYPMPMGSVHVVDADPAPYDGRRRWLDRLANAACGNFYAARDGERRDLEAMIGKLQPDCILCYFGDIALRLADVAREANIPLVAYFHGDFQFLTSRWYRWSLRRRMHGFASIVVVNRLEYEWMLRNGTDEGRLHVVPCGAPTDEFVPAKVRHSGGIRFAMASRLVGEKGCDISIRAFAAVATRVKDATLDVYGDGPMREDLERLAIELDLNERIQFHGYIEEKELSSRLPGADIFIQHSLMKEGSPVSIIEAMSCGIPVVATPVGGIVDQVVPGETGFIVAERDLEGMIRAMCDLAGDSALREAFGRNGRQRAVEFFDSARLTTKLEAILTRLVSVSKGS